MIMMSGTLDNFLPPQAVKSKPTSIGVEETCADCGNKIPLIVPKYRLKIKGEEKNYCPDCARNILHPQKKKDEENEDSEKRD